MKTKVQIITKFFWPVAAGIETNILETYSMQEKSWDMILHTSRDTHIEKNVLSVEEKYRGINIKRYERSLSYWPKLDWNSDGIIAFHNFDILPHGPYLVYAFFLKLIGKKKFKLFLTPHGGFNPEWSIFNPFLRVFKYLYHYTFGVLIINAVVDGVRAVSEWERLELIKKGINKNKVSSIPNGIEAEAYQDIEKKASKEIKKTVKDFGKYILTIGRVYPIKNYETVIKALPNIDPEVKYVIAGPISSVSYKKELDSLIKELHLQDRVIFAGIIRSFDKYYLIRKAQAMVHMAIWESFCNVVHEGLSQGLPIIAADNTALPLLVKDDFNGWCVGTYDQKAVAEKVNYVVKNLNSKKIQDMKARNAKIGLEESWENVSRKMKAFYLSK